MVLASSSPSSGLVSQILHRNCFLWTTVTYFGTTAPSIILLISRHFSTMPVVLFFITLISNLPLPSGDLGLIHLPTHQKLHLAEFIYRCHNSLAPSYLSSLFHRPSHCHNTRTHNLTTLASTSMSFMHFHLLEPYFKNIFNP